MRSVLLLSVLLTVALAGCNNPNSPNIGAERKSDPIHIFGSNTEEPLMRLILDEFAKANPEYEVELSGEGSQAGIHALKTGDAQIAMSSIPMPNGDRLFFEENKIELVDNVLAFDAVLFIVHRDLPVKRLTSQQLKGIFRGEIVNWNDVGGPNLPILVYARGLSSGTHQFVKDELLEGKGYGEMTRFVPNNPSLKKEVQSHEGSIGFTSLAYLEDDLRVVQVSFDEGKTYVPPTINAIEAEHYRFSRPLYFYYLKSDAERLRPLLLFLKEEPSVSELIQKAGMLPVNDKLQVSLAYHHTPRYLHPF